MLKFKDRAYNKSFLQHSEEKDLNPTGKKDHIKKTVWNDQTGLKDIRLITFAYERGRHWHLFEISTKKNRILKLCFSFFSLLWNVITIFMLDIFNFIFE